MNIDRIAAVLAAALVLAACTAFGPQQREVTVSAERVAQALGKRFAVDRKRESLQLGMDKPKVTLDPQAQRLRADFDLSVIHPLFARALTGRAGISGGLAYDAATLTLALREPRIETFEIDGVPPALKDTVNRLSAMLGSELLRSYPLLTLRPQDLRAGGYDYEVKNIEIMQDGIKVTLVPKP